MVASFMRRIADGSLANIEYPPIRDSLRYYWNGYDLAGLTTETGWPDRINGSLYDFYSNLTGSTITERYYSIEHNALKKQVNNNTGSGFANDYWHNGDSSSSTADWTVELVTYLDFTDAVSNNIIGSGYSSSKLHVIASPTNGLEVKVSSAGSALLSTGFLVNGFHVLTITRTYDPSANRYSFSAFADGEAVSEYNGVTATFKMCSDAYLGHAVGCLTAHGRALTAAEVRKNAAYYLKWWKPEKVFGVYTTTADFVAPKAGKYKIQAVGAGGKGGTGGRYTQALIDTAAKNDKEYYYQYYGGRSGGGGGGGGGYSESILSLSAGDVVSTEFTGSATVVNLNGAAIMTANNGAPGASGAVSSDAGSAQKGKWETTIYGGGAGGTASGGNVKNITGNAGASGSAPVLSGGTLSVGYGGAGASPLTSELGYAVFGCGGAGGKGHTVYGSHSGGQFYGANDGAGGQPGVVIISEAV